MKMDSPESSKPTTTNCETAPVQDSPVFSFISNLSPIQTVRAQPVTQGFPELNSPPLVFTSPRLNRNRQSTFLKRAQFPRASASNLSGQGYEKLNIQLTTRLDACNEKCPDINNSPEIDLSESSTGCPEQFLTDIVNVDSDDTEFSNNSTSEQPECESNSRTSERIETDKVHELERVTLLDQVENETKQGDGVFVDHYLETEHEFTVGHVLNNQAEEDLETESVEAEQVASSDQSYHFFSGSMAIGKENETLTEPFIKKVQIDREDFQHRGVRRRCLQFGDAQHKIISNQSTQISLDSDGLRSPSLEIPSIPIKIPKPSGIGLHLNSIVNAVQAVPGSKVKVRSAQWGSFSIVGKKSTPVNEPHSSEYSNSSSSILPLVESVSAIIADNRHENKASVGVTSAMSMPTYSAKPSNDSTPYNSSEDQSTPGNKRKCVEKVGAEEFNKLSPTKKRMKSSEPGDGDSDGDGCKRCNCKKSKCLKLYCDCFAAGIYCADPCACQECFNKPEYEGMVLETRQKIESRDPLAFAPRVVKRITEQPPRSLGEDVTTNFTPSSARHKRGCKCKKSMCLKRYCECYQSNVGCSDGCRCEGCQNVFGRKGEFCPTKDVFSEEDPNEVTNVAALEKCELTLSGNDINHTEFFDAHNLTPPTPAFQFSNHGKDASKAWFPSGEYSKSPEPDLTYMAPYMVSPGSPRNSEDNNNSTSNNNNNDLLSSENTQEILLDLASFDYDSHPPNLQEWTDNSKPQQSYTQGGGGSLGWRGSPNTPVPQQLSGTKLIRDVELSNSVQDETPEILRDDSTPVNAVKVCSPNKKRVSPPHVLRPHEFGSGLLTGLRTGRKFILKAVPSFPPLTPCIDSRSVAVQQTINRQDRSVKK